MKAKVLNKKEVKRIINSLDEQYSISSLKLDYIFILGSDDKLYLIDKKFAELNLIDLRVNSLGLYFGKLEDGKVRLSIEGSQIVGPLARKNIITLSKNQISDWVRGSNVDVNTDCKGFVLVKHGDDFFGSGKCSKGVLFNYVPKNRRIRAS
ncbi:MAG: hypothetical protein ABIH63_04540 [archaeon]